MAIISTNSVVVIGGTRGRSAGVLIVIIGTLGIFLWVDSAGFVALEIFHLVLLVQDGF